MSDFAQSNVAARKGSLKFADGHSAYFRSFSSMHGGLGSHSPQGARRCSSAARGGGLVTMQEQLDRILAREELILDLLRADRSGTSASAANSGSLADLRADVEHRKDRHPRPGSDSATLTEGKGTTVGCEASNAESSNIGGPRFSLEGTRVEPSDVKLSDISACLPVRQSNITTVTETTAEVLEEKSGTLKLPATLSKVIDSGQLDLDTLAALELADEGLGWLRTTSKSRGSTVERDGSRHRGDGLPSWLPSAEELLTQQKSASTTSGLALTSNGVVSLVDFTGPDPSLDGEFVGLADSLPPVVSSTRRRQDRSQYSARRSRPLLLGFRPANDFQAGHCECMESDDGQGRSTAVAAEAGLGLLGGGGGLLKVLQYAVPESASRSKVR